MKTPDELAAEFIEHPERLGHWIGQDKLSAIHGQWIKQVWESPGNVTLMAARGHYKTSALSYVGVIWTLLFNPNWRILLASATGALSTDLFAQIKAAYEAPPLRDLYEYLFNCKEPRDLDNWRNDGISLSTKTRSSKEPNLMAVGIGKSITGYHFDIIHCDDVVGEEDRYSPAHREAKKRWIRASHAILEPTGRSQYVGTPWHPEDAYSICPKPIMYPVTHPAMRGIISNLDDAKLAELRIGLGESLYQAQYLLQHIPDADRVFPDPVYGAAPEGLKVFGYLDPAFTVQKNSDLSALTIGGKSDGKYYIKAGFIWKVMAAELIDNVIAACNLHKVEAIIYEDNGAQALLIKDLRARGIAVIGKTTIKNKVLRIQHHVQKNWQNIIFDINMQPEYMKQIYNYTIVPPAQHDDAPDSLAGLIEHASAPTAKPGFYPAS